MKKRILCIILTVCLVGGPVNTQVFASVTNTNNGTKDCGHEQTDPHVPAGGILSDCTDNMENTDICDNENDIYDSEEPDSSNPETPGVDDPDSGEADIENPEGDTEEEEEDAVITGWKKDKSGKICYYDKNGKYVTGLKKIKSKLYYFDSKGYIVTGLKNVEGKTYYFSKTGKAGKYGAAQKGWITYKKNCYYFDKKKYTLKKNALIDGYKVDKNGKSKTRYLIIQIVNSKTNSKMSNDKKIQTLWKYLVTNKWKYIRTYEHARPGWVWYKGWTDDFANSLMTNKGGNCFRYAAVLGYLVKEATGYPVRIYHGSTPARRGGLTPHGWITVKINNRWYAYDPDLYKFGARSSTYYKTLFSITSRRIHRLGKYTQI